LPSASRRTKRLSLPVSISSRLRSVMTGLLR
jgi:hypothetical protein